MILFNILSILLILIHLILGMAGCTRWTKRPLFEAAGISLAWLILLSMFEKWN